MKRRTGARAVLRGIQRRLALPSALMGLVLFSLTLLVVGVVAYAAAVPSLAASGETGAAAFWQAAGEASALTGAEDGAGEGASAEGQPSQAGGSASADGAASTGTVRGSGVALGGIMDIVSPGVSDALGGSAQDKPGSNGSSSGQSGNGSGGSTDAPSSGAGQGGQGNQGGGSDQGGDAGQGDQGSGGDTGQTAPDPDAERATREWLVSEFNALEGYIAQTNSCVQDFNNDCLGSLSTRLAHQRACDALSEQLFAHYSGLVNRPLQQGSQYQQPYEELIIMYRVLATYLADIQGAWAINVQYDDPGPHVDEFMEPIRAAEVNGTNKHLAEFLSHYESFAI